MAELKYQMVTDWVRRRIQDGELSAGDRLESEHEICRIFGVSRQTVRYALSQLALEGTVEKMRGSGTYIREIPADKRKLPDLPRAVTIISTYIDGYIFPRILREMVKTLEEAGYDARLLYTENHLETERNLLKRILEDGRREPLIVESVMSGLPNPNLNYYRQLQEQGIPVLFFHSKYPELDMPCVRMDDVKAGEIAAGYLISQGHRRIAGIFKADDGQGRRRYQGMLYALHRAGISLREEHICWIDTHDIRRPFFEDLRIAGRLENCTGCVCYNDEMAYVLTEYCGRHGIRIPEDLSVVSIDNSDLARLNSVPLTSVAHPMEELGRKTAEQMLHLIRKPSFQADYLFTPGLEVRSSVKKLCG